LAVFRYAKYLKDARHLDAMIAARAAAGGWTRYLTRVFESTARSEAKLDELKAERMSLERAYAAALSPKAVPRFDAGPTVCRADLKRLRAARYDTAKPDWTTEFAERPDAGKPKTAGKTGDVR